MSKEKLLIVEDDVDFRQTLADYLRHQGFEVYIVGDGNEMDKFLSTTTADLILLDLGLPGEHGLSIARRLRIANRDQAIIMLSASGEEVDRVVGLEVGADDYLPKPVSLREVLARIRAVLRRRVVPDPPPPTTPPTVNMVPVSQQENLITYTFGNCELNTGTHRLFKNNEEITLRSSEFSLLMVFVTHPNQVLSRDRLMTLVRGYEPGPYDRSIDVRVSRLRSKIEDDPSSPSYIRTIRGEGYLFSEAVMELTSC